MAWKEMTVEELAKSLGADVHEVREKHRLIELIKKARKEKKLSQSTIFRITSDFPTPVVPMIWLWRVRNARSNS